MRLFVFAMAAAVALGLCAPVAAQGSPAANPGLPGWTLQEAVQAAAQVSQPGDIVLLSPGGTSYDQFKDFEERGECFRRWVNQLP